ncbi:MAG: cyclopropane-fatty-acyl-phospholipid synthase [Planctomycetota bacterium]|jgi:cyclopropane-fatty-acyl-phospholipid synthase
MNLAATTIDSFANKQSNPSTVGSRFFRRLVLGRLGKLEHGTLTLVEDKNRFEFGTTTNDGLCADLIVTDPRFYRKIALGGSIGAAEAFMSGWWKSDDLTSLIRIFARNLDATDDFEKLGARIGAQIAGVFHRFRRNSKQGSKKNIEAHYDLSNEFFSLFLDNSMTYSCAVFESATDSLEQAQEAKYDRLCRKINLCASDHLLEIGTGWGGFAIHAASNYGCKITTTTISEEQFALANERIKAAGLEDRIQVVKKDYRDLEGKYDKLVSIEMIEAVGHEFLEAYFKTCSDRLKPDGMMALQVITIADQRYEKLRRSTDFIQRYIFPGSLLPSIAIMSRAISRVTDLRITHLDDMTPHYAKTLGIWRERFFDKIEGVRTLGYSEEFIRMWHYYLSYCEAGFSERCTGSIQLVASKPECGQASIYQSANALEMS